jgi:superfamily II DNA/RNA helicase
LAKNFTQNKFTFINLSKDNLTISSTKQFFYTIGLFNQKYRIFLEILKKERPQFSLIFVNTKKTKVLRKNLNMLEAKKFAEKWKRWASFKKEK